MTGDTKAVAKCGDPDTSDEALRAKARELVEQHGQVRAARMLGLSRLALSNLIAALPTQRGTRAQAREALRVLATRR